MKRRVAITGMGAITPVGNRVDELFAALVAGRSGVGPITHFDAGAFPTRFAAEIKDFQLGRYVTDDGRWDECGSNTHFALAAARQALEDAGLMGLGSADSIFRRLLQLARGRSAQPFHCILSIAARGYREDLRAYMDPVALSQLAVSGYRPRQRIRNRNCTQCPPASPSISAWKGRITTA